MGGPAIINGKSYEEFDNFYHSPIEIDDLIFPTIENAFQASKNLDPEYRESLTVIGPGNAYRIGQLIELRTDWEEIKYSVMKSLVRRKLIVYPRLQKLLVDTSRYTISFSHSCPYWNWANAKILDELREMIQDGHCLCCKD